MSERTFFKATLRTAGRTSLGITLPKPLCDGLALEPGDELWFSVFVPEFEDSFSFSQMMEHLREGATYFETYAEFRRWALEDDPLRSRWLCNFSRNPEKLTELTEWSIGDLTAREKREAIHTLMVAWGEIHKKKKECVEREPLEK